MQLTLSDLFASPDHYLFAFQDDQSLFLDMNRQAYQQSIFVDRRIAALSDRMLQVPTAQLTKHMSTQATATPMWIFHIAHCGSTLLGRALDRADDTLVIREPMTLRQLAVESAQKKRGGDWNGRTALANTMLARRYQDKSPVIVKANVPVNFIIPELMGGNSNVPTIFLYFSLEDYMVAILRSQNHRGWVQGVTEELRPAIEVEVGSLGNPDVAERAAALWLAQLRIYERALFEYPASVSLDAEHLFNEPEPVLQRAFALYGVDAPQAEVRAITNGPLFGTYSKNPSMRFDNAARLERRQALRSELGEEIGIARKWVAARSDRYPLPYALARPLYGDPTPLIG